MARMTRMSGRLLSALLLAVGCAGAASGATDPFEPRLTQMETSVATMKGVVNGNIPWDENSVSSPDAVRVVKAAFNGKISQYTTFTELIDEYFSQLTSWEHTPGGNPSQLEVNRMVALKQEL